jgi:ribosomal protein S18 acetylase RimI-like enzyme
MKVVVASTSSSQAAGARLLFPLETDIQAEAMAAGAEARWLLALSAEIDGGGSPEEHDTLSSQVSDDPTVLGAALALPGKDGVVMVWPPQVREGVSELVAQEVEDRLLEQLRNQLSHIQRGSVDLPMAYAQSLADPEELNRWMLLTRIGFEQVGNVLIYGKDLQTYWNEKSPELAEPARVHELLEGDENWRTFSLSDMQAPEDVALILDSTLQGSLDLPCLDGFRSGAQMLLGHLQSPRFCNELTRVAFVKNQPVAMGMLCEDAERATVELSYLGVVFGQRGQKFGQRLLRELELRALARRQRWAMLAVDATNHFAIKLYEDCGYVPLFSREVFISFPNTP